MQFCGARKIRSILVILHHPCLDRLGCISWLRSYNIPACSSNRTHDYSEPRSNQFSSSWKVIPPSPYFEYYEIFFENQSVSRSMNFHSKFNGFIVVLLSLLKGCYFEKKNCITMKVEFFLYDWKKYRRAKNYDMCVDLLKIRLLFVRKVWQINKNSRKTII